MWIIYSSSLFCDQGMNLRVPWKAENILADLYLASEGLSLMELVSYMDWLFIHTVRLPIIRYRGIQNSHATGKDFKENIQFL
jgi:hypothetical protein